MLTGFAGENRTRRPITQRLVETLLVVKTQPAANALARLRNRAISFDEHVLIFQAAPQPLDKDVVEEPPFPIHADPDTARFQFIEEARAGELDPLIGVEYFRRPMTCNRVLQRLDAEIRLH